MAAVGSMQNVVQSYMRGRRRIEVLHSLNLKVRSGEFGLMGSFGFGKTTLLNRIGGLDKRDECQIAVAGERPGQLFYSQLSVWRSHPVGCVLYFYNLLPMFSAERNIEVPLLSTKMSRAQRKINVPTAPGLAGLSDRARRRPTALPGGQHQRVADLSLLACDEPDSDPNRESAEEIVRPSTIATRKQGKTTIMATHDPRAAAYATRLLRMDKGTFARDESRASA